MPNMARKICFLDRDGTLNVDSEFLHEPDKIKLVPGAKELLSYLKDHDFEFVLVTNQSGIGRGFFDWPDFWATTRRLESLLEIEFLDIQACPHHPQADREEYRKVCDCRKPKPGMIHRPLKRFEPVSMNESFLVGDSSRDCWAAHDAGLKSFLLLSDRYLGEELPENCQKVSSLLEVLDYVI